ncbi:diphosphomevalonate decarboxylase [Pediococcus pentosaceus]|uniref:diphosphomevalonate decarboxylase n=1 Tax=Pediococcus pentosaceus TaxID=1255 RepID=A0ABD7X7I3_PEDPE|nr:diphosphomevalonate decarboxylase [Pediococcus pentosaceus]AXR43448.1 diphosphomevalonate decarboxylase [Pediococcus pentosaceus]KAF0519937.1 diphosphomevalonate decarboxylase [Pediococcus pentosaceus]MBF7110827.1 diphosphomevalonate decarboxylase [Pediococcus pentosaceus]MBF7116069.1 diphosphomevalonate decarboxylase [Pediococcus pentosaceus]MBF7117800.1 diphosphomevalonate decarboxylase [Pediococcus pentosaceus]
MNEKYGFARAHTNIALLKYWGKINSDLILPANDSISLTLDKFYTDTEVTFSDEYTSNLFYLNHQLIDVKKMQRINRVLEAVKSEFGYQGFAKIESKNHVPTAAGLASSASGMAALAGAAVSALGSHTDLTNLSRLARLGSGSASRSVFGGIVHWHRGYDHQSSFAEQIVSEDQIDLNMVTIVIDRRQKKVKSTLGMQHTASTSPFYPAWVEATNQAIPEMISAVQNNDFTKIGELAEHSAAMMHATTLSSKPAFTYFAPETIQAIKLVEQLRESGIECYYTIDAGPNVKVLCQSKNITRVKRFFASYFDQDQLVVAKPGSGIKFTKN